MTHRNLRLPREGEMSELGPVVHPFDHVDYHAHEHLRSEGQPALSMSLSVSSDPRPVRVAAACRSCCQVHRDRASWRPHGLTWPAPRISSQVLIGA